MFLQEWMPKKLRSELSQSSSYLLGICNPAPHCLEGPPWSLSSRATDANQKFLSLTRCGFIWPYPGISPGYGIKILKKSHAVAASHSGFPVRDHVNFLLCHRHWQRRQMSEGTFTCNDVKSKLVQNSSMRVYWVCVGRFW